MSRTLLAALLLSLPLLTREAHGQAPKPQDSKASDAPQQVQEPPEEDPSYKPRTYDFNPLKAAQSITAGNFYFDKKNYAAAKGRYLDATLYDPGSSEAFDKLGEAEEKLHEFAAARQAYAKYLGMEPTAKDAAAIKKRMEKWPRSAAAKK